MWFIHDRALSAHNIHNISMAYGHGKVKFEENEYN